MIDEIKANIRNGMLDDALKKIDLLNAHQQLEGKILKSRIYERLGEYPKAHQFASEALGTSIKEGRKLEELGARVALAYSYVRLDEFDLAFDQISNAESLLPQINQNYFLLKQHEATLINIEGLCYRFQGKLHEALERYQESLEIRSKLGIKEDVALSLTNIGTVLQIRGDLDEALSHHIEALENFVELGDNQFISVSLHSIAEIYWEHGEFEIAKNYFEKSLNIKLNQDNQLRLVMTLFSLVLLNSDSDYREQSVFYLDMLEEVYQEHENDLMIAGYFRLAKAYLLKRSTRIIKRAEGQKIFEEIIDNPPLDYKLSRFALLNLCDMLIRDLKVSKSEESLLRVQKLTDDLLKMAKYQYSSPLLVETYLLKSKLALINLDLETSTLLLTQAEMIAREKGLINSAKKISSEYDDMMNKLSKWDQLQKRNASLVERVEEVDIQETIDDLLSRRTQQSLDSSEEKPLFLLILDEKAITLYSRKFQDAIHINEHLIGGFLMATDFGIGEVLDDTGSIERIKYGDHNLIFMKQYQLTFCYGFEGQSYYAIQRLRALIDRIKLGRSWVVLTAKITKPKDIKNELDPKIDDFFMIKGMFTSDSMS